MASPARASGAPNVRPQSFGRYTLLRRIGAGGMGEIYLAKLPGAAGVDKLCVVKKVLPHLSEDRSFSTRFLDEARVAVQLTHGNICQIFDVGEVDEALFLAMEYVEGKTVGKVAQRARERQVELPVPLVLWIGARLMDGLGYAHRKTDQSGRPLGVVHRDVSPNNVILTYDGEVKIIDFGAAKSTVKEEKTAPRLVIGNITYMAPEQARKQHVDPRADVFSAAVVLYEMVTRRPMPVTGDFVERWRRAANPTFDLVSTINPRLPKSLDEVFEKALAADPRERFADAEAFRDALIRTQVQIDPTTSTSALSRLMKELFSDEQTAERNLVAELLGATSVGHTVELPISEDEDYGDEREEEEEDPEERRGTDPGPRGQRKPSGKTTISRPRPIESGPVASDDDDDLTNTGAFDAYTGEVEIVSGEAPLGDAKPRTWDPGDAPTIAMGNVRAIIEANEPQSGMHSTASRTPGPWAYVAAFVAALGLGLALLFFFGPGSSRPTPAEVPPAPLPPPAKAAEPAAPDAGVAPGTPSAAAFTEPAPGTAETATKGNVDARIAAAQERLEALARKYGKDRVKLPERLLGDVKERRRKGGKAADGDPKLEEALAALEGLLEQTAKGFAQEK